jgi:DNA polymerase-3 subunit alpha
LELLEIVDKIEIYNLAREVLLPRYSRGVFVVEDTVDGGVRGENAFATSYLRRSK